MDTPSDRLRLTVPEAAEAIGISPEAVRNRLSRGTLDSEKEGGRVYVLLDRDTPRSNTGTPNDTSPDTSTLVEALQRQITTLEEQLKEANEANRENRRIIAGLVQRIPELEAAQESPGPDPEAEEPARSQEAPETATRRPWWQRVFGK